jgi:5-methylcytosine-specific restriction protein A
MGLSKKRRDYLRSDEAKEYRKLYSTQRWRKGRLAHLRAHPLCVYCAAMDQVTAATVVDHRVPHKGDLDLFYDPNNYQSLCAPCHDGAKSREESIGYSDAFDVDGYPIDAKHPVNARGAQ